MLFVFDRSLIISSSSYFYPSYLIRQHIALMAGESDGVANPALFPAASWSYDPIKAVATAVGVVLLEGTGPVTVGVTSGVLSGDGCTVGVLVGGSVGVAIGVLIAVETGVGVLVGTEGVSS
jgi:hypothetical protein